MYWWAGLAARTRGAGAHRSGAAGTRQAGTRHGLAHALLPMQRAHLMEMVLTMLVMLVTSVMPMPHTAGDDEGNGDASDVAAANDGGTAS